eukprot:7579444-Pyramimonas_sp.AAC.1
MRIRLADCATGALSGAPYAGNEARKGRATSVAGTPCGVGHGGHRGSCLNEATKRVRGMPNQTRVRPAE